MLLPSSCATKRRTEPYAWENILANAKKKKKHSVVVCVCVSIFSFRWVPRVRYYRINIYSFIYTFICTSAGGFGRWSTLEVGKLYSPERFILLTPPRPRSYGPSDASTLFGNSYFIYLYFFMRPCFATMPSSLGVFVRVFLEPDESALFVGSLSIVSALVMAPGQYENYASASSRAPHIQVDCVCGCVFDQFSQLKTGRE